MLQRGYEAMKYIFFLIIIPFLLIPSAYAERGNNYDKVVNSDNTITWTSSPERLFDGSEWINYQFTNAPINLTFDAFGGSIILNKLTCEFRLFEGGFSSANTLVIENYYAEYYKDNVKSPSSCVIDSIIENEHSVIIKLTKDGLKTKFILKMQGLEWFYDLDNQEGKRTSFKIIEICENCNPDKIEDGKLFFGKSILDTKNEQHETLKGIDTKTQNIRIEYEKILDDKEKFEIDPTFSSDNPTIDTQIQETDNDATCETTGATYSSSSASNTVAVGIFLAASSSDCTRGAFEWDISSIPVGATINDVDFSFEITVVEDSGVTSCDFIGMDDQPSVAAASVLFAAIGQDTVLLAADITCDSVGQNLSLDMNPAGNAYISAQLASGWAAIGVRMTDDTITAQTADQQITNFAAEEDGGATPPPTLTILYNSPSAVRDLIATEIRGTGVDLSWGTPTIIGVLSGYQINFTTPHNENVASILPNQNNTESSETTAIISDLIGSTDYSFRIGVWETSGAKNMSGNVLNITTGFDPTAAFTAGSFNLTAIGTDVRNFKFERIDLNTTALLLNVTYPNTFNASCNFYFKFAMVNQSHFNLADVAINAAEDEASFRFEGVDNEIIDVTCQDHNSNVTGDFLITQTSFMILQQIQDFQSGAFGTMGKFGALDLITVFAVTASMIGFNRINESVGVILGVIMIGGFSVFQLIQWETTFTASLALVVLWAYTNTRKT